MSQVGSFIVYKIKQAEIKEEIKTKMIAQLSDEAFKVFENPRENKEIDWEEADKEFTYHGEMYDVVRIEKGNTYYCLKDSKEKKLLDEYGKQQSQTLPRKAQNSNLGFLIGFILPNEIAPFENSAFIIEKRFFLKNASALEALKQITTPPPKVLG